MQIVLGYGSGALGSRKDFLLHGMVSAESVNRSHQSLAPGEGHHRKIVPVSNLDGWQRVDATKDRGCAVPMIEESLEEPMEKMI